MPSVAEWEKLDEAMRSGRIGSEGAREAAGKHYLSFTLWRVLRETEKLKGEPR